LRSALLSAVRATGFAVGFVIATCLGGGAAREIGSVLMLVGRVARAMEGSGNFAVNPGGSLVREIGSDLIAGGGGAMWFVGLATSTGG